jgi:periplasmic divalent cation tolerance protein
MKQLLQFSTTTETKEEAETIVEILLEKNLIACGHIHGPITSHYRWEGKLVKSEEFVVLVKSLSHLEVILKQELTQLHPYDLPEILGTILDKPSQTYLDWVAGEVRK